MRYFPILDELFASDTIIFLLIGLAFATVLGIFVTKNKITTAERMIRNESGRLR